MKDVGREEKNHINFLRQWIRMGWGEGEREGSLLDNIGVYVFG